jgi:hypothetical protein
MLPRDGEHGMLKPFNPLGAARTGGEGWQWRRRTSSAMGWSLLILVVKIITPYIAETTVWSASL